MTVSSLAVEVCGLKRDVEPQRDGQELKIGSYLLSTHIAQPATSTPPRNMAKQ